MNNPLAEFKPERVKRFLDFHRKNPHVYEEFVKKAKEIKERGHKNFSAQHIVYHLRTMQALKTLNVTYKISNNFTKMLAKVAANEFRELQGFFKHKEPSVRAA